MIHYGIWHDERQGDYSIIRWDDQEVSRIPCRPGSGPWRRSFRDLQQGYFKPPP